MKSKNHTQNRPKNKIATFSFSVICYSVFFAAVMLSPHFNEGLSETMQPLYPDLAYCLGTFSGSPILWIAISLSGFIFFLHYNYQAKNKYIGNHEPKKQNKPQTTPLSLIHVLPLIILFIYNPSVYILYFLGAISIFLYACIKFMACPNYHNCITLSTMIAISLFVSSYMIIFIPVSLIIAIAYNPWRKTEGAVKGIFFILFIPSIMGILALLYCYTLVGLGFMPFSFFSFDLQRAIVFWPDIICSLLLMPVMVTWILFPHTIPQQILALNTVIIAAISSVVAMGFGFNISTVWIATSVIQLIAIFSLQNSFYVSCFDKKAIGNPPGPSR